MDSLANYGSDGDNSNSSDDAKISSSGASSARVHERRSSDANYDPVQMDMSEESNNNNSSNGDTGSDRAPSPPASHDRRRRTCPRRDSSRQRSSPADQRRSDRDIAGVGVRASGNAREDRGRSGGGRERSAEARDRASSRDVSARSSAHDEKRHRGASVTDRGGRDAKRSRTDGDGRSSRDEDGRRGRKSSANRDSRKGGEPAKDRHRHRRQRGDRDRGGGDRSSSGDRSRDHRSRGGGDRERRGESSGRDGERTKERSHHREESRASSRESKEKSRDPPRSRSRSKERPVQPSQTNFRTMSYREEKGRNKLAQLEKLGIELKPLTTAVVEPILPAIIGEPNYYNPMTTATQGKYAEQIQKRKLLWANKSKQEEGKPSATAGSNASTWMGTTFTHDQDGKVTAKFKRLMGIKDNAPATPQPGNKPDILKKQEEMFNNMEQQYEVARATTHTQRGVGLGYATGGYQFPR